MKAQYIEINKYGTKFYYSDKEMEILHREDGPAIEWADGSKCKCWCLNGIEYSEKEFNERLNPSHIYVDGKGYPVEYIRSLITKA